MSRGLGFKASKVQSKHSRHKRRTLTRAQRLPCDLTTHVDQKQQPSRLATSVNKQTNTDGFPAPSLRPQRLPTQNPGTTSARSKRIWSGGAHICHRRIVCHNLRQAIVTPGVAQVAPQPIERRAQQATQVARGPRRLVRSNSNLACGNGLTPSSAPQTPLAHQPPPKKNRDGTETTHPPLSTLKTCSTKLVSGLLDPDAV